MSFRVGQNSQCIVLAWVLAEARVSLKCFQSEWKGQVWLFYDEQRWSIYLCWLKFPVLPFHPSTKLEAERSFQRIWRWWLQEPVTTQLCAFFQASSWRKECRGISTTLYSLADPWRQSDHWFWTFKKLNLCWEILPSSLLLIFTDAISLQEQFLKCLFPWVFWMQLWLLFYLGVWWVHLSSSPKLLIIGKCWDSGLSSNFCMWIHAVPAESCSELDNTNLRKQIHSSHSLEGFIRGIPSCVLEM